MPTRNPLLSLAMLLSIAPVLAAQTDDQWMQGAAERIERHRMADVVVSVVDAAGKPLPDAHVSVEQTRHAFLFGCNFFQFGRLANEADEQAYREQFGGLFNYATLGFYWPSYERQQSAPDHAYAEQVAKWCQQHGITTKGHPLAWNYFEPRWLPDDLQQVKRLQLERITDCVSRFEGLIDIWDVVNEATHFEREELQRRAPKLTRLWQETGRVEFVNQCFQAARAAGPNATLLINDYRTDPAYARLVEQMPQIAGKNAYDVIGIQSHMHSGSWTNQKIGEVCERFARFNVPLHFTELTILSGTPGWERQRPWVSTPEGEKIQAEEVRRVYTMLFSYPSVTAITWWDFADRNAWQGAPAGLIGQDLKPKPAYNTLKDLVKGQWWTRVARETDQQGQIAFRGFLGDYKVQVRSADGRTAESVLRLVQGDKNAFQIVVQ